MVCQNCKKDIATVHLVDIKSSGEKQELHLCEKCAQEKGLPAQSKVFNMQELLSFVQKAGQGRSRRRSAQKCDSCGMTYEEFRAKGRFGCARDYETFQDGIVALLEKIQGASQYAGKVPRRSSGEPTFERELMGLRQLLARVVKEEQYEEAARLRDRIQELEKRAREESP
ncbi:MAG: UvrB/UvrC motif-containing protein [Planctomycetota bacterium]